ncbi:hypothetical protein [Microlunatus soli]|uniref:Uncharacterized protein n=1 Tax=Microlunatus soli TaxID=630515 RepID=A0A1H1YY05_9ACTN|nr:hypothetical protein [Microlunatus soli]SDT26288.1 hypothetical protein SAMN04489812_4853 [Microlunatus soli]
MTVEGTGPAGQQKPRTIRAGTLWAGGLATAFVAGLVAAVGVVVSENVLTIKLIHVGLPGNPHAANWLAYPVIGFLLAIAATALLHLLLVLVPQPIRFFNWIIALVAVLAAALPFASGISSRTFVTSAVDLLVVLAIWLLLTGTGARALRPVPTPRHSPDTGDSSGPMS